MNNMSISQKQLGGKENQQPFGKVSFSQFVTQQQRQFGKEISNISTRCNIEPQPFKSMSSTVRSKSQSITLENFRCRSKMEEEAPSPQGVTLYVAEIFEYLQSQEHKYLSSPYYMNHQQDVNSQMRGILVDWLIDVHVKFKLLHETLFLTVNLIDRYLSKTQILRSKLQLVGVAAMFIASKFEEIYAPELKDFVYVCDHAYTKEEILEMESLVLTSIQFNLTHTSSLRFLERQVSGANLCEKVSQTAKMILDLALLDIRSLKFCSSVQSTASILLAINMLKSPQVLPSSLHYVDNQDELKQCLQEFLPIIQLLTSSTLTSIKRKYSTEKWTRVSEIVIAILQNQ